MSLYFTKDRYWKLAWGEGVNGRGKTKEGRQARVNYIVSERRMDWLSPKPLMFRRVDSVTAEEARTS